MARSGGRRDSELFLAIFDDFFRLFVRLMVVAILLARSLVVLCWRLWQLLVALLRKGLAHFHTRL